MWYVKLGSDLVNYLEPNKPLLLLGKLAFNLC